ncbi:MAG: flagellar basal body rod protein FlgB [Pseudomonadota bacterium]|jgi:flagellar basal-body rod protein FlgB
MRLLDSILNQNVPGLAKAMDLTWQRNKVITANVANISTPKYRASDMTFGQELDKAFSETSSQELKLTDNKHLDLSTRGSAQIVQDYSGATKADGNNVDIDLQMAALAKNSSDFSTAAQLARHVLSYTKNVIREAK